MRPTPVLCPDDLRSSGYIYGWKSPVVVVSGVLDADTIERAQNHLQRLVAQSGVDAPDTFFGGLPVVLGRCTFAKPLPALSLFDPAYALHRLVLYHRPDLRRMQMFTLHAELQLFRDPVCRAPRHVIHDKTPPGALIDFDPSHLPVSSSSMLRPETVNQLNYGRLLADGPLRAHSAKHAQLPAILAQRGRAALSGFISIWRQYSLPRIAFNALQTSVVFSQVSGRLLQTFSLPMHYPQATPLVTTALISNYVMFYNCIWLILNDIIIGWASGSIICEHATTIANFLEGQIRTLLIDDLQWALVWLNNWPAGLKLNSELSQFYCHLLLGAVVGWNRVLQQFLLPYLPQLVYVAGAIGSCGITFTISLCSDVLALTTAHVQLCYQISCFVYQQQLGVASSLWNLFRGRRYNVLRHRVDSWSYDLDQLLFGTILFTLAAFIFPTTLAYYALFAGLQLVTSLTSAILNVALVLVDQFPLFALLLRFKDPRRLPGGIVLRLGGHSSPPRIENQTITLSAIFVHYYVFFSSFARAHHPARLVSNILRARPVVGGRRYT